MGDHMPSFIALSFAERRGETEPPAETADSAAETSDSPEGEDAA